MSPRFNIIVLTLLSYYAIININYLAEKLILFSIN